MTRDSKTEIVSARVSLEVALDLDNMAAIRGISRSTLLADLAEAAVAGRVIFDLPDSIEDYSCQFRPSEVAKRAKIRARIEAMNIEQDARKAEKVAKVVAESRQRVTDFLKPLGEK